MENFLLTILSSVAQQEVENTSAYDKKRFENEDETWRTCWFSGCLGYDYDVVTKSLSINEEGAETVRYIFDRLCCRCWKYDDCKGTE